MRGRAGPCRFVPPSPNSLKSLMRAGWRGGCVAVGLGACNPLKTLSVPVRARRVCEHPHTPYRPQEGELGAPPRGSRRQNSPQRRSRTPAAAPQPTLSAMDLKIAPGNTREPPISPAGVLQDLSEALR
jgi:hypothetical protein